METRGFTSPHIRDYELEDAIDENRQFDLFGQNLEKLLFSRSAR